MLEHRKKNTMINRTGMEAQAVEQCTSVGRADHSFVSFVQHEQIWSGSKGSRDLAHMGVWNLGQQVLRQ